MHEFRTGKQSLSGRETYATKLDRAENTTNEDETATYETMLSNELKQEDRTTYPSRVYTIVLSRDQLVLQLVEHELDTK